MIAAVSLNEELIVNKGIDNNKKVLHPEGCRTMQILLIVI